MTPGAEIMKHCPTCHRTFEKMTDYPKVIVDRIEFPDTGIIAHPNAWNPINAIEVWKQLAQDTSLHSYLQQLRNVTLKTKTDPETLLPRLESQGYFKWAFTIKEGGWKPNSNPDWESGYYLGFQNGNYAEEANGISEVILYTEGPNMGSAGGPTLQGVGTIAKIYYQGST